MRSSGSVTTYAPPLHIPITNLTHSIFFIPTSGNTIEASTSTVNALAKSVLDTFDEEPYAVEEFDTPFTLQHRLLRSQASPAPQQQRNGTSTPQQQQLFSYQHILRLTSLSQTSAYCFVQKAQHAEGGSVVGIPVNEIDSHTAFLVNQLGALWTVRLMLQVQSGRTFSVGEYSVQMGAVTSLRANPASAGAAAPVSPGVVVAITRTTEDEGEEGSDEKDSDGLTEDEKREALDYSTTCIHALFGTVLANSGLSVAKSDTLEEFSQSMFTTKDVGTWPEKQDMVRLWCRVLRLRG